MSRPTAATVHPNWVAPLRENPVATAVARGPATLSTEAEVRQSPFTAHLFKLDPVPQSKVEAQPVVTAATTSIRQESSTATVRPEETISPVVLQQEPVREVRNLLEESDEEQVELRLKFAAMEVTPKVKTLAVKAPGLAASKFAIKPSPPASVASNTPAASQTDCAQESATSSKEGFWAWWAVQQPKNANKNGF